MPEPINSARAVEIDDVVLTVSTVRYSDDTPVVRVDVEQQAFEDKSYVDLSVDDALWVADAIVAAANYVAAQRAAVTTEAPPSAEG